MAKKYWYLIVRGDGSTPRVVSFKKRPSLRSDEIALTITLDYPEGWKKVYSEGPTIKIPPPPAGLKATKSA